MNLIETFGDRLQKALEISNMKQVDLVNKTGLDKTLINKYLAGLMKAKQDKLSILAKALNVNEVWLMGYDVPIERTAINLDSNMIQALPVIVLGKISAGLPLLAEENRQGYAPAPSSILKNEFNYFYLKVDGDSMNLKFNNGDFVLIQQQDSLENGEIGVIRVNGYDATIKKYKYENGFVFLLPMSSNPKHDIQIYNPKEVEIAIIGKVIWHQGPVLYEKEIKE